MDLPQAHLAKTSPAPGWSVTLSRASLPCFKVLQHSSRESLPPPFDPPRMTLGTSTGGIAKMFDFIVLIVSLLVAIPVLGLMLNNSNR